MKRSEKKRYYKLERQLNEQHQNSLRENELVLTFDDFKKGHLVNASFIRLKDESWYIPYGDRIIVKVPDVHMDDLRADLGFFAVGALSKIKADRQSAFIQSIVLFIVGLSILGGLSFWWDHLYEMLFITELVTIISWVFIWSGVAKWFIEQRDLQDKRFTILQLLSAELVRYQEEKNYDTG